MLHSCDEIISGLFLESIHYLTAFRIVSIMALLTLFFIFLFVVFFLAWKHWHNGFLQRRMNRLRPALDRLVAKVRMGKADDEEIRRTLRPALFACFERHLRDHFASLEPLDASAERTLAEVSGFADQLRRKAKRTGKWRRALALRTLSYLRNPADLPLFRRMLKESDFFHSRYAAALGLAVLKDVESTADIIRRLSNSSRPNRDELLTILSPMASEAAETMHLLLAEGNLHDGAVCVLIDLLREIRYCPCRTVLESLMASSGNPEVRIHAMEALGLLGDASTVLQFRPFLADENFRFRLKALSGLAIILRESAIPDIEKGLDDHNWFIRRATAENLYRIGGQGRRILRNYAKRKNGFAADVSRLTFAEVTFGRVRKEA